MKVLFLINSLQVGGTEKSWLELTSRLRRTQAVICHIYPGKTLKPAFEQAGVPVISLDVSGKYGFATAIRRVGRVVRREKPDLIHTALFKADVAGRSVGRRLNVPVVGSLVSEPYAPRRWQALPRLGRIKLRALQLLDVWTGRWSDHFVANSEAVKGANAQALRIPPQRISVIYRGRDPAPFVQVAPARVEALRASLGLAAHSLVVLNVARLLDRKGQADLIRAMPLVRQAFPRANLFIAGEGGHRPALEALVDQLGLADAVHLLGQRNDVPLLLHLADVFVLPSHYEGFPGALVEAMLAARPIVASDIAVHREAIDAGETGRLATIGDPQAIAAAVVKVLGRPVEAKAMGRRAQQAALERFHVERMIARHEDLYEMILKDRGRQ